MTEPFDTETMAELCARQGRLPEALGIYRRLIEAATGDDVRERRRQRMAQLEELRRQGAGSGAAAGLQPTPSPAPSPRPVLVPASLQAALEAAVAPDEASLPPAVVSPPPELALPPAVVSPPPGIALPPAVVSPPPSIALPAAPGVAIGAGAGAVSVAWALPADARPPALQIVIIVSRPAGPETRRETVVLDASAGRLTRPAPGLLRALAAAGFLDGDRFIPVARTSIVR